VGKFANERAHREWERQQDRAADAYFGDDEPPITESELAEIASDKHFERVDYPRTDRHFGGGFA
jgi:hypothetical protein